MDCSEFAEKALELLEESYRYAENYQKMFGAVYGYEKMYKELNNYLRGGLANGQKSEQRRI